MSIFWDCQSIDCGLQRWPDSKTFVHELSHRTFVQEKTNGGMKYWNKQARESFQRTTKIGCMAFHPHAFVIIL
eukprot:8528090-Karenia_brevis.AAC.1